MKSININTKQGQNMLARARVCEGRNLRDVYASASSAKVNAFNACKERCCVEGGWNFRVCSHNTFNYSVAWETARGVRVETANNSYLVEGGSL